MCSFRDLLLLICILGWLGRGVVLVLVVCLFVFALFSFFNLILEIRFGVLLASGPVLNRLVLHFQTASCIFDDERPQSRQEIGETYSSVFDKCFGVVGDSLEPCESSALLCPCPKPLILRRT